MTDLYRPAFVHSGEDLEITQGADWPFKLQLQAQTIAGAFYTIDTTDYTASFVVRATDADGDVQLSVDTTSGEIVMGLSPAEVERSTAYVAGQRVTAANALYECITGGTTDGSPVIFNDTLNATTNDGTVVWENIGDDGTIANLVISIPAASTTALTAWGRGVYTLKVEDTYGHTVLYLDGAAYLRQEVMA